MITKENGIVKIVIPEKFSEKQIGEFMDKFWSEYKKLTSNDKFYFDFTQTEWIANQNLLLLSGLIKYLYKSEKRFTIRLFPENLNFMKKRQAEQICQLWDVWKLYIIFDERHFENYIESFENNKIPYLYEKYGVKTNYNLFDRFSVIPFVSLNYIKDYGFENTNAQLKPVYTLNNIINQELNICRCSHPFTKRTISAIITRELYDNFLDHFDLENSLFHSNQNWAFMSISLKRNRIEDNQFLFNKNFEEEEIQEAKSFFYDSKTRKYKNENLIQFSFIDFGAGIVESLSEIYNEEQSNSSNTIQSFDNRVLEYAFRHNTSRNPIIDTLDKKQFITRGLFDLIAIVKRYKGLLIVRSNKGKILYNFSETDKIKDAFSDFDREKEEYFPGTYISIYISALGNDGEFDESVIDIEFDDTQKRYKKSRNINIFSELFELDVTKNYNQLLERLANKLQYDADSDFLTYISFWGVKDENIIRKIIFFLAGNYEINRYNRIIIVYPPDKRIIEDINSKIATLNISGEILSDFKIHPIPCIYYDIEENDVSLEWIGISNKSDKKKLDDLLYEEYSLAKSDLEEPYKAIGNTNRMDQYGNLSAKLPDADILLKYYKRYESAIIEEAIEAFNCIKKDGLYLCNGNYYQEEFLQLTDILNNKGYRDAISLFLLEKIKLHIKKNNADITDFRQDVKFIAITASSHKILDALIRQKDKNNQTILDKANCIFLDSYLNFEDEIQNKIKEGKLKEGDKCVLVCDAIATGNLTVNLNKIIEQNKAQLIVVAVIADTLDYPSFESDESGPLYENYKNFKEKFIDKTKFIYLYKYPTTKKLRNQLSEEQKRMQPIRINPYTNIPVTFSDETTFKDSILLSNEEFLECIDSEDVEIRFKLFNNLIHPYFFKTSEILKKEYDKIYHRKYDESIVYKIFQKIKEKESSLAKYIFYPKYSDIRYLKLENLQIESSEIFGEGGFKYYELERYNSGNGWKFPHTTDYFKEEIKDKSVIILDDGSCSGDSLYQMINELSYYLPDKITVISIIGRVEDHKREFFSRIKSIQAKDEREKNGIKDIAVKIYFGTHWHIPTFYQEENPYKEELQWLNTIIKIQNTPDRIKKFAKDIKNEIKPLQRNNDYKYFPKPQDSTIETKKEILRIRNEIGKVTGYRFYKENFNWFNEFVERVNNTDFKNKEINKDIEHFLMCFVYEPYLYKKIAQIIPEIKTLVQNFVATFIFNELNVSENLNYKWRKIDMVHLYFIAYTGIELINNFKLEQFKHLINFIGADKPDFVNYILYKLLYYLPDRTEQNIEFYNTIRKMIDAYLQGIEPNKYVKLYRNFISSLGYDDSFNGNLSYVYNEYRKINDSQKHKEAITINIENLLSYLDLIITNNRIELLTNTQNDLKRIFELINRMLSISGKYREYLSIYIDYFEDETNSLRNTYHNLTPLLIGKNNTDWEECYNAVQNFRDRFLNNTSVPYKIFSNTITEKYCSIIEDCKNNLPDKFNKQEVIINDFSFNKTLYFPVYIFKEIVMEEIFRNLSEYADDTENITINISVNTVVSDLKDKVVISIENKVKTSFNSNGSYIGTHRIKQLNKCPDGIFYYSNNKEEIDKDNSKNFVQIITIKHI
jgi:orotate phosphoribosyltransferase